MEGKGGRGKARGGGGGVRGEEGGGGVGGGGGGGRGESRDTEKSMERWEEKRRKGFQVKEDLLGNNTVR